MQRTGNSNDTEDNYHKRTRSPKRCRNNRYLPVTHVIKIPTMNKNSGFTLLEVLIAMLVLAVGLLGLAGLQATSLRNNQSAYNRSQATQLAYDLADRMRNNASVSANYLTTFMAPTAATCAT